jgi:transcriptional regulator with XRE-family HTH domain
MLQFKDKRLVKFGIHVQMLREKAGLHHNDIATITSLTKSDLLAIEQGSKNFGFTTLLELARGLAITPSQLLDIKFEE